MSPSARVVLGGTFDRFHIGHEALLRTAFATGDQVAIGLTTPRFLATHPKPGADRIEPYARRRRRLSIWLRRNFPGRRYRMVRLDEPMGRSVEPGWDVLVVSADTRAGAARVNRERRRRGLPTLRIVVVPLVLADDLAPVSSRRIRAGEVSRTGRRCSRIDVRLSLPRGTPELPWRRALRAVFPKARFVAARARDRPRSERLVVTVRRPAAKHGTIAVRAGPVDLVPRPFPWPEDPAATVRRVWPRGRGPIRRARKG